MEQLQLLTTPTSWDTPYREMTEGDQNWKKKLVILSNSGEVNFKMPYRKNRTNARKIYYLAASLQDICFSCKNISELQPLKTLEHIPCYHTTLLELLLNSQRAATS